MFLCHKEGREITMIHIEYIPMQYYDAIIIRFTDEEGGIHNIIIDGGEIHSPKYCYTDRLKNELTKIFDEGETIDLWVITHIDNDHIGGLYNFVNDTEFFAAHQAQLNEVWMNYGGKGDYDVQRTGNIGYHNGKELRNVLQKNHTTVKEGVYSGYTTTIANAEITVIAPDEETYKRYIQWWNNQEFNENVETSDGLISGGEWDYDKKFEEFDLDHYEEDKEVKNNSSIAFVLAYRSIKILFSGDSCSSLLLKGLDNADILKDGRTTFDLVHIPHHGSCRNSSLQFFKTIECPKYVITGNGNNRHNLPDKETIARLNAANQTGCELHFTALNDKLQEIFKSEDKHNLLICDGAKFEFE